MSRPFNFGPSPVGWKSTKLRTILTRTKRLNHSDLPLLSVNLPVGVVPRQDNDGRTAPSVDLSGYQLVVPGDLVMNQLGKPHGALGVSPIRGIISPAYFVATIAPSADPRFIHHLLRTRLYISEYERRGKNMPPNQFDIGWDQFREIEIMLPPLSEQRAIADHLDAETAHIDALTEKKKRMIKLLLQRQAELERTAVVGATTPSTNAVVTTGNQLIPMIPATWRLVRARFLCSIETGSSDTDESSATGTYPFFVRSQTPQLSDRFIFDTEAVLTAGDGAGVGKVFHHFRGKFDAHQRVYVLHRFREVEARFFYYCFSAYFALAALDGSAKSTVDSVRRHMITEFPVPVPPREEQIRLVNFLDTTRARTERLVDLVTKELELLRERRQSLITAAVTGELEISKVAA